MSSRGLAELIVLAAVIATVVAVISVPSTGPTYGFAPDTETIRGSGYNWGNPD
jgi:hypothetical protein